MKRRRRPIATLIALTTIIAACATTNDAARSGDPIAAEKASPPTTQPPAPTTTIASATTTTTTTTSTTTTTTTTLPPFTIGFAGDTSLTHGLHARDPFGSIADVLAAPDVMIVNLETTVAESSVGAAIQKRFTFKSPPVTGSLLAESGIDVAALANNHALDYGPDAVIRTIEILNEADVATAGTGRSRAEAYSALRLDVAGWDLAVLSFSRVPCDSPEPGESYIDEVAWACPQFEDRTIAAVEAAADADFTVVMIHWGIQRDVCPGSYQRELAAAWIAEGADAVIGSHPHVLQGVEQIDDAWVVHSTGNFAFPSARNASSYTALFTLHVTADGERLEAIPMRIEAGRPVMAVSSRAGILEDLTRRSFGFTFDDSGEAIASPGSGSC